MSTITLRNAKLNIWVYTAYVHCCKFITHSNTNISIVFLSFWRDQQSAASALRTESDKEEQNDRTSGNFKGPAEHAVKTKEVKVKSEVSVMPCHCERLQHTTNIG